MEKFNHLDPKTLEIAGIAASVAAGCSPCLEYHFKKAIEVGCTLEQAEEAVELGKMIKSRPVKDMSEYALSLIKKYNVKGN